MSYICHMETKKLELKDYKAVKNGYTILVYEQNNISENNGGLRDGRLDLIGEEVETEHGLGTIVAVELAPTTLYFTARYIVEITDNYGIEILKSLFPDNRLAYYKKELVFKNKLA